MHLFQKTILKPLIFSGVGLHSGESVVIKLLPAPENSGINFIYKNKKIEALWKNAIISQLCTKLKKNNLYLSTIEHLMSALSGLGVSNIIVKISSSEIPIMDGSSKDFVEKILEDGLKKQNKEIKFIKVRKKISFTAENKYIEIEPTNKKKLIIDYTIDYQDEFIKKQNLIYEHSEENYMEIYKARTFCLHKDLEKIFSLGLAKGGSLDNAIVVSGKKILNQGGLRYDNEFVKHKILDCVGDLYLAGSHIIGKLKTFGGGHELNLMILKELFKNKSNFEIINSSSV
ncbi:MAG: UDP-3-O-acyl-N-acetylglucosamine deacetylase [Pelagibacteraceae bacterium]|jgi:UDP-3-O-[3-hydroxymyristoyl] N-acetylglucosamine deacetylase|nr:UDP-3-O-acyl-N-acetylglucosamine deacetylase [Pelagibacteraceae bacterium]MCI5079491.1 UDP-3-O-acyl-N-acetylglucosamine deacetylase [Pelagibacteraceae bacterium]